jgi:predicted transposase YdaD
MDCHSWIGQLNSMVSDANIRTPTRLGPAEARALVAARDPTADPQDILDLVETILVYKFATLSREEIRAMLHLPESDLKKTRFYQEVFGEGRQEGRQEGHQRQVRLVIRLLIRRLGTAAEAHQEQVAALSFDDLGALGEALLDFNAAEDLTAWLESH